MITVTADTLVKRYGATHALTGLSMRLRSGEVVGLAGPNGAGKSTLTRILAGEEQPDAGRLSFEQDGAHAASLGNRVALVHQEPQLWPNLTVRENLAVGRESWSPKGVRPAQSADATLEMLGIGQFADFQLSDLSLATQQRVEIARAIMCDADVFLFDEPNSALTDDESRALFATMARLAQTGKVVLLITHRLADFVRCCDRVLILQDGRIAGELCGSSVSESAIATALIAGVRDSGCGDRLGRAAGDPSRRSAALRLERFHDPAGRFHDISMELDRGRIVVLAGVEGSGARELVRAIGLGVQKSSARVAIEGGATIAFVAASRQDTIFPNLSVGENLVCRLADRLRARRFRLLSLRKIAQLAGAGLVKYAAKARSHLDPITALSGGNQQKVAVGAALEQDPDILVLEEPTRGVDVLSKRDIYDLLRNAARLGKAVLLFCTEVPEMFAVADAVVVMARGTVVGRIEIGAVASVADLANLLARYEAVGPSEPLRTPSPPGTGNRMMLTRGRKLNILRLAVLALSLACGAPAATALAQENVPQSAKVHKFPWGEFHLSEHTIQRLKAGKPIAVTVDVMATGIPRMAAEMRSGMQRACAQRYGKTPMACQLVGPVNTDIPKQLSQLETLLHSQQVDCLVVQPPLPGEFTKVIDDYVGAGIPVYTFNIDVAHSRRFAFTALNETQAGEANGTATAMLVKQKGLKVNQILLASSAPDETWARERMQGFRTGYRKIFPDAKFFNDPRHGFPTGNHYSVQEALNSVTPFLTAHPNVNLVFHTDQGVEGVGDVIQNLRLVGKVFTSGFNVTRAILAAIDRGVTLVTIDQDYPLQTQVATASCGKFITTGDTPADPLNYIKPTVITRNGGPGLTDVKSALQRLESYSK